MDGGILMSAWWMMRVAPDQDNTIGKARWKLTQ